MEALEKLREIRKKEDIEIKPSPYLKKLFDDGTGELQPIVLRNYQKQMIFNLLLVPNFLCADDTGLGKTIEILSTIGYVWMKEPEYVPIIITTKSALFQWKSEVLKFMDGMEVVTVHGTSIDRETCYKDFFSNLRGGDRKILLLTYDNIMYDMEPTIARDPKAKPRKTYKKEVKEARDLLKTFKELSSAQKEYAKNIFSSPEERTYLSFRFHVASGGKITNHVQKPSSWDENMEREYEKLYSVVAKEKECETKFNALKDEANVELFGIQYYIKNIQSKNMKIMLVMDEMHKLKNPKSKFHDKVNDIAKIADRRVGVTATPVENRLMEFWALYKILVPGLFPKVTKFQNEFCITKLQPIGGGRKVPVVVGYKNLDQFISRIEPYFLSRKKHEVAKDLPSLVSKELDCVLSDVQEELYEMAEDLLEDVDEESQADMLRSLTMCQQASDAPCLIMNEDGDPFEGPSSKIDALMEVLEENEGKKTIIFSKFEKMITEVARNLSLKKIKHVRITGAENTTKREESKKRFQDRDSGYDVVLLTTAGSESINLQAAELFIFLDLPWSVGKYIQLVGRAVRIGSLHQVVVAYHFLARRVNGDKTIDHHILKALRSKKKLADKVAGNNLRGGLEFTNDVSNDVFRAMQGQVSDSPKKKKTAKAKKIAEDNLAKDIFSIDDLAGI